MSSYDEWLIRESHSSNEPCLYIGDSHSWYRDHHLYWRETGFHTQSWTIDRSLYCRVIHCNWSTFSVKPFCLSRVLRVRFYRSSYTAGFRTPYRFVGVTPPGPFNWYQSLGSISTSLNDKITRIPFFPDSFVLSPIKPVLTRSFDFSLTEHSLLIR